VHISGFQVQNYKSFADSNALSFTPGFNVIVGQNNVGKTALLQAMGLRQPSQPHRSLVTIPRADVPPPPQSLFHATFEVEAAELDIIFKYSTSTFLVPIVGGETPSAAMHRFLTTIGATCTIQVTFQGESSGGGKLLSSEAWTHHYDLLLQVTYSREAGIFVEGGVAGTYPGGPYLSPQVADALRSRIYGFRAERFNVGQSPTGTNSVLAPDASNLPEVLHNLTANPVRFNAYCDAVRTVFPQIQQVTIPLISQAGARILLWTDDPRLGRDDLALPLTESGTGVGQVLAILYVVLNSPDSRIILVDEPQSFLHPGAIRKLFEIMRQHPQHQYIVTTHSPTAITAAEPTTLFLVKKEGATSAVESVDLAQTDHTRMYLRDIGARLSDVFGADAILWVEGPTEERCFPLLVTGLLDRPLMGTLIRSVIAVGDLERKDAGRVWEIYERLSSGGGLLPPALGFIFDREDRDDTMRLDLERRSKGRVAFLPRRMYESYLVHPQAIAAVIQGLPDFRAEPMTVEEVTAWLDEHRWDRQFIGRDIPDERRDETRWHEIADAARLLNALFNDLSATRYTYRKVEHGTLLTRWLIAHAPDTLSDVTALLAAAVARVDAL